MLIARSSLECRLYIGLHPCACGDRSVPPDHRVVAGPLALTAVYSGPCPRCGTQRRFELVLSDEIAPLDAYGGASASALIDAGQFMAVAEAHARITPPDSASLDRAIAALDEVLKLIPPGDDAVPPESFTSDEGRALYDREPGRFRRARVEAVRNIYRSLRASLE